MCWAHILKTCDKNILSNSPTVQIPIDQSCLLFCFDEKSGMNQMMVILLSMLWNPASILLVSVTCKERHGIWKGKFFLLFMWSHTSSPYCIQLFFYKSYFMQAFRHYNYPLALDYHQCLEYELYTHIIIQMKRFVRNHLKFPIMQQESKYSH